MTRRINLAVPAYSSRYDGAYVRSIYRLLAEAPARGLSFSFSEVDYSDIEMSRNYLLSNFYFNRKDCDHLLMVDSDMGFGADLIEAMMAFDRPLVGVVYPRRAIDLRRLHASGHLPFAQAVAASVDFVGALHEPRQVEGEFIRMRACGTGILLISRACVERMVERVPAIVVETATRAHPLGARLPAVLGAFDKIQTGDEALAEDFSFCRRWTDECGGEIWACFTRPVSHVGSLTITTTFADKVRASREGSTAAKE
jgi:hypothetical protein